MSPEEKIARVLQDIKNEMGINPNPNLIEFKFNDLVVGGSIVGGEDERKILLKLQKENIIKIKLMPYHEDNIYKLHNRIEDFIFRADRVLVQILDNFSNNYEKYKKFLGSSDKNNYWNYVNQFWLLWQVFLLIKKFVRKNKWVSLIILFLTIIAALVTLYTSDYSKGKENIRNFKDYIQNYI